MWSVRRLAGTGLVALGCALGVSAANVEADPFDPGVVDAAATWVAHVDVAALSQTGLLDGFRQQANRGEGWGEFNDFLDDAEIDPFAAVFSVTMYGLDEAGEEPVVVLLGDKRVEQALEQIAEEEDSGVERIAIGRGVGYRVDDWLVAVGSARSEGKRLFVAAKGEDKLRRALRVIVGDLPSYTGSGPEGDAVVFFDAAVDLDDADFDEAGVAEGLTASLERVRVEVVVADDMAHVRAVLTFEDEESAQAIKKMVEGVLAMGQIAVQQQSGRAGMAESQAAAAVALLQGMDIEAAGRTLEVSLDVSTSLLEQLEHFEDDDD